MTLFRGGRHLESWIDSLAGRYGVLPIPADRHLGERTIAYGRRSGIAVQPRARTHLRLDRETALLPGGRSRASREWSTRQRGGNRRNRAARAESECVVTPAYIAVANTEIGVTAANSLLTIVCRHRCGIARDYVRGLAVAIGAQTTAGSFAARELHDVDCRASAIAIAAAATTATPTTAIGVIARDFPRNATGAHCNEHQSGKPEFHCRLPGKLRPAIHGRECIDRLGGNAIGKDHLGTFTNGTGDGAQISWCMSDRDRIA